MCDESCIYLAHGVESRGPVLSSLPRAESEQLHGVDWPWLASEGLFAAFSREKESRHLEAVCFSTHGSLE